MISTVGTHKEQIVNELHVKINTKKEEIEQNQVDKNITEVKNQDYKLRVKLLWLEQLGTSTIKRWENHQKEGEK